MLFCKHINLVTDFERHDDDELGFRKNDIITIISQKDEHCWVGELNGLRGNKIYERNFIILFEYYENELMINPVSFLQGIISFLNCYYFFNILSFFAIFVTHAVNNYTDPQINSYYFLMVNT